MCTRNGAVDGNERKVNFASGKREVDILDAYGVSESVGTREKKREREVQKEEREVGRRERERELACVKNKRRERRKARKKGEKGRERNQQDSVCHDRRL